MSHFNLKADHDDGSQTMLEFDETDVNDLMVFLNMFVRGCGFTYEGSVGIVPTVKQNNEVK